MAEVVTLMARVTIYLPTPMKVELKHGLLRSESHMIMALATLLHGQQLMLKTSMLSHHHKLNHLMGIHSVGMVKTYLQRDHRL
jgi:hypothetical protein